MNKNIKEAGKNTRFRSDNQPKRRGRKTSVLSSIEKFVSNEDGFVTFDDAIIINKEGNEEVKDIKVKLPNTDALASTYLQLAMKNPRIMIDLINRVDGKPVQRVEQTEVIEVADNGWDLLPLPIKLFIMRCVDKSKGKDIDLEHEIEVMTKELSKAK